MNRERWTMLAAILGSASVFLNSHRRQRRPLQDRQGTAGDPRRGPRGPDLHRQRLPRDACRARHPGRRAGRLLRPAPGVHDRPGLVRVRVGPVRSRPHARAAHPLPGPPGRDRGAPRAVLAVDHHGRRSKGRPAAGRSASGRRRPRPPRSSGRSSAGCSWTRSRGAWRSSSTSRSSSSPSTRRAATWPIARRGVARPVRLARRGGRGARGRRPRVRGHPSARTSSGTTRSRSSRWGGHPRHDRVPVPHGPPPNPLVPLSLFKSRDFSIINLSTLLVYGALYVNFGFTTLFLQGVLGYSALGAALTGLPVGDHADRRSPRGWARSPGRIGGRVSSSIGPALMALARCGTPACRSRASRGSPGGRLLIPPVSTLVDILPRGAAVRARDLPRRRPAHDDAHGFGARTQLRARLRDQQRDLAGRPAAPRGRHLHRPERDNLATLGNLAPVSDAKKSTRVRSVFQPLNPAPAMAGRRRRSGRHPRRRSMPSTWR